MYHGIYIVDLIGYLPFLLGLYLLISTCRGRTIIGKFQRSWSPARIIWGINAAILQTIVGIIFIIASLPMMIFPELNRFVLLEKISDLLIFVGIYFLISSLISFRRRCISVDPHCRICDYILLHLKSDRCPECGTTISPENTIIGKFQRQWRECLFSSL